MWAVTRHRKQADLQQVLEQVLRYFGVGHHIVGALHKQTG